MKRQITRRNGLEVGQFGHPVHAAIAQMALHAGVTLAILWRRFRRPSELLLKLTWRPFPMPTNSPVVCEATRFYIDHGMIHDRETGKHVTTDDDTVFCDGRVACCALLNQLAGAVDAVLTTRTSERGT